MKDKNVEELENVLSKIGMQVRVRVWVKRKWRTIKEWTGTW